MRARRTLVALLRRRGGRDGAVSRSAPAGLLRLCFDLRFICFSDDRVLFLNETLADQSVQSVEGLRVPLPGRQPVVFRGFFIGLLHAVSVLVQTAETRQRFRETLLRRKPIVFQRLFKGLLHAFSSGIQIAEAGLRVREPCSAA